MTDHPITPPPELSPAAQAVLDAVINVAESPDAEAIAAAALRAVANQVVPQSEIKSQQDLKSTREAMVWGMENQAQITRHNLLAIAAELEGLDG